VNSRHINSVRTFLLAMLLALAAASVSGAAYAAGNMTVHFLDVGQGDCILIQCGQKNVLIDGGEYEMGPVVVSYLTSVGTDSLDLVVATHPHSDHVGGLSFVLRNIPVRQVLDSGKPHTTSSYTRFLSLADQMEIPLKAGASGQIIPLGPDARIEVLSPPSEGYGLGLNEDSLVLRATFGSVSFLLMSDVGTAAEQSLLDSHRELQSEVLKVGHHASPYSSQPAFLRAVMPSVSVITVGSGNDYGYPSFRVLRSLAAQGSAVYRTDQDGDIVVTTDGKGLTVTTSSKQPDGEMPRDDFASPDVEQTSHTSIWDLLMWILKYLFGGGDQI